MKIAIIHDWLVVYAGAEQMLEQLLICYPQADIFSVIDFIPENNRDWLLNKKVKTTFIQKLPFARKKYRAYLPLMPFAIEQLDLSQYDLIISSSHAVAKGVITGPDQIHISYVHSPMRYAWDLQHQYLKESGLDKGLKGGIARYLLSRLRKWDVTSANRVDYFIANSHYVAKRIQKYYRRDAVVIHEPVDTNYFVMKAEKENFYFVCSRMVPYKRIDLIVEAFSEMPDKHLVVIGDGPDFKKVQQKAGSNITLLGYQPKAVVKDYLQRAKAFIFAAIEDFGIAPVEAMACGTPVIAFGKGGILDSVRDLSQNEPTGVFYYEQSKESLKNAVACFEINKHLISAEFCRMQAEKFSQERFREMLVRFVLEAVEQANDNFDARNHPL